MFVFASCKKEKVSNANQQVGSSSKIEEFSSLFWQSSEPGLMYIELLSRVQFPDFAPWLEKNLKVELTQEGDTAIHVLPFILYDDRSQAAPLTFYTIKNIQDWGDQSMGLLVILAKQNAAIDFNKKADVRITIRLNFLTI